MPHCPCTMLTCLYLFTFACLWLLPTHTQPYQFKSGITYIYTDIYNRLITRPPPIVEGNICMYVIYITRAWISHRIHRLCMNAYVLERSHKSKRACVCASCMPICMCVVIAVAHIFWDWKFSRGMCIPSIGLECRPTKPPTKYSTRTCNEFAGGGSGGKRRL